MKYLGDKTEYDEDDIDEAIEIWRKVADENKEPVENVIEFLGIYLGNILVTKHGYVWCAYTDKRGTNVCVTHPKISITTFPHSTIYKAAVEGREGSIKEVTKLLNKQVSEHINDPEIKEH